MARPHSLFVWPAKASAIVLPVVAVAGFWTVLPFSFPRPLALASAEDCIALGDTGGPHKALHRLEQCSALDPGDVELLTDLGEAYERDGVPLQAEAAYRRALALWPAEADVRLRLARLLLARGEAGEAAAHVTEALRVQPNRRALIELLAEAQRRGAQP